MSRKVRLVNIPLPEEILEELAKQISNLSDEDKERVLDEAKAKGLFRFKSNLIAVMRTHLDSGGISIEEMERSLEIIRQIKLVEDNGVLEMDDDDWKYLERKLSVVRVDGFDERWIALKKTVANATKDLLDETPDERKYKNGRVREKVEAE